MKKCDIIVPVYNSPEWVKLCVYALFKNTPEDYIGKVILMNDNSDVQTLNCLENLREKYNKYIELYTNDSNLGFIKNVNKGFEKTKSEYVLLLNTDCLVSKNTIPKLIEHCEKNKKIGLICPISSNAANLSLDIFENYSYMQMDEMLYKNFKGKNFDACTVVGNCLLITKECLEKTGPLDEIYGMGYGDETDYQFKAHEKGFEAKVAIDTYVFHKSEVSFGTSPEKQKRLEKNRKIFFDRWGKQYNEKMQEYIKNDPIEYINKNIKLDPPNPEVLFFLPDIIQNAGGVHIVVDIVNYLNINGVYTNILTERIHDYKEIMIFAPSYMKNIGEIKPKCIVATIYPTIFFCEKIAKHYDIPCVNFMQGYEPCFDNGEIYSWAELATKNSQNIMCISKFLKDKCQKNFNKEATIVNNGINIDLLFNRNVNKNERKNITLCFRDNFNKGDFILVEILKLLTLTDYNIEINLIYSREILYPINNKENITINKYKGPLDRKKISEILFKTDIFVDAAILEGFGLMPLESMAAGAIPIVSESFGIDEFVKDGENGYKIKEINNFEKYIEKITYLLENEEVFEQMQENARKTAKEFDIDKKINDYINYFKNVKIQPINLTEIEKQESKRWIVGDDIFKIKKENNVNKINAEYTLKRKIYINFLKLFPKPLKEFGKKVIRKIINILQKMIIN